MIPKWRQHEASGRHKGIEAPNVNHEIMLACTTGDSVDPAMFVALHTTIDLDGLYDILEMSEVRQSWQSAAVKNAREE